MKLALHSQISTALCEWQFAYINKNEPVNLEKNYLMMKTNADSGKLAILF